MEEKFMEITMENFEKAAFDVFSMFNDRWALVTAGTPERYNTMTIGWGTMGTIWGPAGKGRQIIEVFLRENRKTADVLLGSDYFTVCFFPEEKRKDLAVLGSKSGWQVPDKIGLTSLTPKPLDDAVGFEEASLTFVCRKLYTHKMDLEEVPEEVRQTMYTTGNPAHYVFMGEIVDVFGTI